MRKTKKLQVARAVLAQGGSLSSEPRSPWGQWLDQEELNY